MEHSIIRTEYSELMQKSYIDYAMSVIIARALPDVRDGLKPVQRRTLYDMYEKKLIRYATNRIVRVRVLSEIPWVNIIRMEILRINDALVVMAQDFKRDCRSIYLD